MRYFFNGLFIAGIAAGIVLRFLWLPWMEFKQDEFVALLLAVYNVAHPLVSIGLTSSVGIPNPPIFIWLLSLPTLLTHNPVGVTWFIVLLNCIGIVLLLLFLIRFFSLDKALAATAIVSTAPWAILYSRKIWAQDLLFPFLVGFFWLIASYCERPKPVKVWLLFLLYGILSQLHMSVWFALPALVLFFLFLAPRLRLRDVGIGIALCLLLYTPYIAHMLMYSMGSLTRTGNIDLSDLLRWPVQLWSVFGMPYLFGPHVRSLIGSPIACDVTVAVSGLAVVLCVSALLVGMYNGVISLQKNRSTIGVANRMEVLWVLLVVTLLAGYLLLNVRVFPHYFLVLGPSIPILMVLFTLRTFRAAGRGLLAVVVIAHLTFSFLLLQGIRSHPDAIKGDYGTPYILEMRSWQHAVNDAVKKINGNN